METGKNVFTPEFKQETLDLIARSRKPLAHVARDLGLEDEYGSRMEASDDETWQGCLSRERSSDASR